MTTPRQLLLGVASVAAIAIAYGPLVVDFSYRLWQRTHYQHAPFVLLAAVVLYFARAGEPSEREPRGWAPWLLYTVAAPLLAAGLFIPSPMLGVASLWLVLAGWGYAVAARTGTRFPWAPWALLWLIIPPPAGLDGRLMQLLQRQSSRLSSYALDLLGVDHLMDGNALTLVDKSLFVDEACSGIVSVVSIIATAAMYGVWRRRGAMHTLALMALSAGWAALLNVVRIVVIALAWEVGGLDLAEGLAHTWLGLAVFGLSLLVLVANDWLLQAALAEVGARWDELTAEPIVYGRGLVDLWDRFASHDPEATQRQVGPSRLIPAGIAISALGLAPTLAIAGLGATQLLLANETEDQGVFLDPLRLKETLLREDAMPSEAFGMQLVEVVGENRTEASLFGEHSVVYHYETSDGRSFLVSCDFPFYDEWHDLSACYSGIGWTIDERQVHRAGEGPQEYDFVGMQLTKPSGQSARVVFAAMGADGTPSRAPTLDYREALARALTRRSRAARRRQTLQVQVLVERRQRVSLADEKLASDLFHLARARFVEAARSSL